MREICPSYVSKAACKSLLNMAPVCVMSFSWVIFLSLSRTNFMCHFTSSTPSKNIIELSVVNLSWSILMSRCCQVSCRAFNVQEKVVILCQPLQYCQPLASVCAQLFHQTNLLWPVSCRRCGIHHGPPSMDLFLSTSNHYPGIKSRDHLSTQELACLNGKFLCLCPWVNIIGPWMKNSAGVRLQIIYSHPTVCT